MYKRQAFFHVDAGSSYDAERFVRMCVASPWHAIERALGTLQAAVTEFGIQATVTAYGCR